MAVNTLPANRKYELNDNLKPTGDQPRAIGMLADGVKQGLKHQTLLGATGSGKTFSMAGIIAAVERPALVIAHNKTLAAQLATEFREFFPNNSVGYFVSYYDYYQPESYIPRTDTYIEKDSSINDEINRLRLAATTSLMTRRDTVIVASVSCIFGLGSPEAYRSVALSLKLGDNTLPPMKMARRLIDMQYQRNDIDRGPGQFRIRGDSLEVTPSHGDVLLKIQYWGDEIEAISEIHSVTGELIEHLNEVDIYPAKHFVTPEENWDDALREIEQELEERLELFNSSNKLLEAQRLRQRTMYDLEMLRETGTCSGVENYSRPLGRRAPGSAPWTLLDYFPEDFLIFIDESHITLPQLRAMYKGDLARKTTLVEHGFRLPSAIDNRPLAFEEFEDRINQVVYVSATPGPYEQQVEQQRAEQIIRPTGLVDPQITIRPSDGQIDDLMERIRERVGRKERVLVTTLTKKMAEHLAEYLAEAGVKVHYLHSEINTLERAEILRNLRLGTYDVVVGINLLREGLDLPEVSLVAILDADKEGYLRSDRSLIQIIGRAARHVNGSVVMYADRVTDSMRRAIDETDRRREIQEQYNIENKITPRSIFKEVKDITDRVKELTVADEDGVSEGEASYDLSGLSRKARKGLISDLEKQMLQASKQLKFEKAAHLRDRIKELRTIMELTLDREIVERSTS